MKKYSFEAECGIYNRNEIVEIFEIPKHELNEKNVYKCSATSTHILGYKIT